MEAKDTVLRADAHYLCRKPLQDALLEQAKISFKSGKREGIREVIEDMNTVGAAHQYPRILWDTPMGHRLAEFERLLAKWQSQLKKGGAGEDNLENPVGSAEL